MKDWEVQFREWAKPPGTTEEQRCQNTEQTIRNAINVSDKLKNRNIKVFVQGSYRNNTNVRKDSDIDIGIVCSDTFFHDLPEGYTEENFRIEPATYFYDKFKNEVEEALVSYFGRQTVRRGNKAFNIRENTYRVDADVVPFFEHRRYHADGTYLSGVELKPDNGGRIINWPEQHYQNGVSKNNATDRRFKAGVRILKSLRNEMDDLNYSSVKPILGFLIECLIWNVPNDNFGHTTYKPDVRSCLAFLFNNTMDHDKCSEWGEVSELKYLFRKSQKESYQQAHKFVSDAWDYLGLE